MREKLVGLRDAAKLIKDGDMLALGGLLFHRVPMALVREIIRQQKRELAVMKTSAAIDVDMLCGAGSVKEVHVGHVSYENEFGVARRFRQAVESGRVKMMENACYTVVMSLRGAAFGVPFMPAAGINESDLVPARGFKTVSDPYGSGKEVVLVPTIKPDVAIIHAQEADALGNTRLRGSKYNDALMARAAKTVIVETERIVDSSAFQAEPENTDIPGFMVSAVYKAPYGAHPASCFPLYTYDSEHLSTHQKLATNEESYQEYLNTYVYGVEDEAEYLERVGGIKKLLSLVT